MAKLQQNYIDKELYLENTPLEKFFLYKIAYPVVNIIGLNRKFNLWWHRIGRYREFPDGRCMWCGEKHRLSS